MNESDVRRALHRTVLKREHTCPRVRIIDEFGLAEWGAHRADVVVVSHDLHGFELKSGTDSLDNLDGHIKSYSAVCDRVTIVAAQKFISALYERCPSWWGISVIHGDMSIDQMRAPEDNPAVDCKARLSLMWRNEAWQILKNWELGAGRSKLTRKKLQDVIHRELAPDQILRETLEAIRLRTYHTGKREAGLR